MVYNTWSKLRGLTLGEILYALPEITEIILEIAEIILEIGEIRSNCLLVLNFVDIVIFLILNPTL